MRKMLLNASLAVLALFGAGSVSAAYYTTEALRAEYMANRQRPLTQQHLLGRFENGAWTMKPLLDYGHSPALKPVEDAVKAGDYQLAGERLLSYFRNKKKTGKKLGGYNDLRISLWKDGYFGFDQQLKFYEPIPVSRERRQAELPVGRNLKNGTMVFCIVGRKKNGVVSRIAAKESGQGPMMELIMKDGTVRRLPVREDTYVRPGKYSKTNYGGEKTLEICNSGIRDNYAYDENTREAYLLFDVPRDVDVKQVRKATVTFTAWSEREGQRLLPYFLKPSTFQEDSMTWANATGYMYTWEGLKGGVNWDCPKGAHSQTHNWIHRLYWLPSMTRWAHDSKNPADRRLLLDLILDYAKDYPTLLEFTDNLLNASGRPLYLMDAFPYLIEFDECTPQDCMAMLGLLHRDAMSMYINHLRYGLGDYGNQGLSKIEASLNICVQFPEFADKDRWLAYTNELFDKWLVDTVLEDTSYTEHCFGYAYGVLNQMQGLMKLYAESGMPMPESLPVKTNQLARYLMFASLPDGVPPRWGEGVPYSSKTSQTVRNAARLFGDPELLWWCYDGKQGREPRTLSVAFPTGCIAVIRDSWKEDANAMFFASKLGGGHYHHDQNALILYAYGTKLLNDTGMSSYSSRHPHFDWQRHQTRSHNTVEVDGKGYPRLPGNAMGPSSTNLYLGKDARLIDGWADGYPFVRHHRRVLNISSEGIYVVSDFLNPKDGKAHTYDQCWHIYPLNSYETNKSTGKVWTTNDNKANLEIIPVFPGKRELLLRKGFNAVPLTDTIYPSYRIRKAGSAEFVTLLAPRPAGQRPFDYQVRSLPAPAHVKAVQLTTKAGPAVCIFNYTNGPVTVKGITTDGLAAFVQFDRTGKVRTATASAGSHLSVEGRDYSKNAMALQGPPPMVEDSARIIVKDTSREYKAAYAQARQYLKSMKTMKQAVRELEKALEFAQNDGDRGTVCYELACALSRLARFNEAGTMADKVQKLAGASDHVKMLSLRIAGRAYESAGDKVKAIERYEAFLRCKKTPPPFRQDVERRLQKLQ